MRFFVICLALLFCTPAEAFESYASRAGLKFSSGVTVKWMNSNTVSVQVEEAWLFSGGQGKRYPNVDLTISVSASGPGGLDDGSEAPDTWYYIYLIGKEDGSIDGLLSADAASPLLPCGWVFKGWFGATRNVGNGFRKFVQRNNHVAVAQWLTIDDEAATVHTPIDLSERVPPMAVSVDFQVVIKNTGGSANNVAVTLTDDGDGTSAGLNSASLSQHTNPGAVFRGQLENMLLSIPQQIDYRVAGGGGATALADEINVRGWRY